MNDWNCTASDLGCLPTDEYPSEVGSPEVFWARKRRRRKRRKTR